MEHMFLAGQQLFSEGFPGMDPFVSSTRSTERRAPSFAWLQIGFMVGRTTSSSSGTHSVATGDSVAAPVKAAKPSKKARDKAKRMNASVLNEK